tara:strand:+ start:525 stop:827 length:303 start_codon:yes stop_codon:yes gene_type:complete
MTTEAVINGLVEIGEIPAEVLSAIGGMRERTTNLHVELGKMEVRKAKLIVEISRLEDSAQRMLQSEADRMGIPRGVSWQLTPQGKANVSRADAEGINREG